MVNQLPDKQICPGCPSIEEGSISIRDLRSDEEVAQALARANYNATSTLSAS